MDLAQLKYDEKGLIPAVVQDIYTGEVLMLAYMNREAIDRSIETGFAHYWSRSRQQLWMKGEISGNTQEIYGIQYDCDGDTVLLRVAQKGSACHTDHRTCFFRDIVKPTRDDIQDGGNLSIDEDNTILNELYNVIEDRRQNPIEGSYTNYLFDKGIDKILKKVGEESTEVVIGAKNNSREEIVYEVSDLIYHLLVLLVDREIKIEDIFKELRSRR